MAVTNTENPITIEKWRLADVMGISLRTLSRWLNEVEYDELVKIGYQKYQHYITRKQLDYLFPSGLSFDYYPQTKRI